MEAQSGREILNELRDEILLLFGTENLSLLPILPNASTSPTPKPIDHGKLHPLSTSQPLFTFQTTLSQKLHTLREIIQLFHQLKSNSSSDNLQKCIRIKRESNLTKFSTHSIQNTSKNLAIKLNSHDPFTSKTKRNIFLLKQSCLLSKCEFYEEVNDEYLHVVVIYGRTFIADFKFDLNYENSVVVSFRHLYENEEIENSVVNQDLEMFVKQNQFEKLTMILQSLIKIDVLDERFNESTTSLVKNALRILQSDVISIRNLELKSLKSSSGLIDRLIYGHGLIRCASVGIYAQYYVSSFGQFMILKQKESNQNEDELISDEFGVFNAWISAEASQKAFQLALTSSNPSISDTHQALSLPISMKFEKCEVTQPIHTQFVMHLQPNIIMTRDLASCLNTFATKSETVSTGNPFHSEIPSAKVSTSLLDLLCPNSIEILKPTRYQSVSDSFVSQVEFDDKIFTISQSKDEIVAAVVVSRIPFGVVSQIHSIFSMLRQQIVFNELYSSCFNVQSEFNSEKGEKSVRNGLMKEYTVELVTFEVPRLLQVTMRALDQVNFDESGEKVASLSIEIGLNGMIDTKLSLYALNSQKPESGSTRVQYEHKVPLKHASITNEIVLKYIQKHRNIPFILSKLVDFIS
eukprot:CAMPEP_0182443200 /NCGR_PEP_ID=MMETSP1172-20130603/1984_1 /TAXON_ID=708627 /ORGANISM="Timspurckia oligopyrenoides, Strain CCMP3278" /LENGTH=633 /DNA_ID=CAMNT_0024638385 /DNA_START=33 /DNA_END=1934 /DNA_ORIENTATION=+